MERRKGKNLYNRIGRGEENRALPSVDTDDGTLSTKSDPGFLLSQVCVLQLRSPHGRKSLF